MTLSCGASQSVFFESVKQKVVHEPREEDWSTSNTMKQAKLILEAEISD